MRCACACGRVGVLCWAARASRQGEVCVRATCRDESDVASLRCNRATSLKSATWQPNGDGNDVGVKTERLLALFAPAPHIHRLVAHKVQAGRLNRGGGVLLGVPLSAVAWTSAAGATLRYRHAHPGIVVIDLQLLFE